MTVPSYIPRGTVVDDELAAKADAYNQEIQANGGWWSAALTLSLSLQDAEEWFENGLNRHIETSNPGGQVVWAGFVNQVTVRAGTLVAVRGPLMDVTNRCSVVYTPILDATRIPPLEGTQTTTTIADAAVSQAHFGILESVVNGGKRLDDGTTDDATQHRNLYLQENRDPPTSRDLNLDAGDPAIVTLDLLGYVHRLKRYVYQDTTALTIQVDTKIQAVFVADPNGLFSTDYSGIATNNTITSRYENTNSDAWTVLQQEVALGDTALNRYIIGVYGEQRVVYEAIPDTISYQHAITGEESQVELYPSGALVDPWDVQVGEWLFLTDFLAGRGEPADLRTDPRLVLIESARYTAPWSLGLSGAKVNTLPQMLARMGG